jgi:tetratricopeptide (TPR) repeat protein
LSSNPINDGSHTLADLERAAAERPDDAQALVALANAYWLAGSGPEPVSELASRAMAADPENRAAWHLWALAESDPRQRVARWQQVSARFPTDDLARANVADNAAALAGAEHDYDALDLAIATYEQLLSTAEQREQRDALDTAIRTLRAWKF